MPLTLTDVKPGLRVHDVYDDADAVYVFVADLDAACEVCGRRTDLMLTVAPESADPIHLALCLDDVTLDTLVPVV